MPTAYREPSIIASYTASCTFTRVFSFPSLLFRIVGNVRLERKI
jgi:hypothetical protein